MKRNIEKLDSDLEWYNHVLGTKLVNSYQISSLSKSEKDEVKEADDDLEYEAIAPLKEYKINYLEKTIAEAVQSKYKISFYKGVQIGMESLILFILMISVVLKANIFSMVYFIFIIRYLTVKGKTQLLVHATVIIALCFIS